MLPDRINAVYLFSIAKVWARLSSASFFQWLGHGAVPHPVLENQRNEGRNCLFECERQTIAIDLSFSRTAESIEPYFVSSTSENPLEDFHAAVAEIRLGEKPATIVFDGGIYDFSAEDGAFLNLRNCSDLKVIGNG